MSTKDGPWTPAYFALLIGLIVAYLVATFLRSPNPWVESAVFGVGIGIGVLLTAMLESIRGYASRRGDTVLKRVDQTIGLLVALLVVVPFLDTFLEFVPPNAFRLLVGTGLGFLLVQNLHGRDREGRDAEPAQPEHEHDASPPPRRTGPLPVEESRRLIEWETGVKRVREMGDEQLLAAVKDANPGARWHALERLRATFPSDPSTHRALADALEDSHSDVQGQALVQLMNLAQEVPPERRDEVVATIERALESESEEVRRWALGFLRES
jgi:hypothetical protein